jgi:CHAD domain-containing protein
MLLWPGSELRHGTLFAFYGLMTEAKNITELYKVHENSLRKHLRSALKPEEEPVHKLRVDIKQFRSLIRFLKFSNKDNNNHSKLLDLLSPVFKTAGLLRTNVINLKLSQPYRSRAARRFKEFLKSRQAKQKKKLVKELKDFNKKKFAKLSNAAVLGFDELKEKTIPKKADKFVAAIFSKIRRDMSGLNEDENFHRVRKNLKNIKTINQLLQEITPSKEIAEQLTSIKNVEQKIGQWHDTAVLAEEMEKYIAEERNTLSAPDDTIEKDLQKLAILVTGIKAENERAKKSVARQLKKVLPEG